MKRFLTVSIVLATVPAKGRIRSLSSSHNTANRCQTLHERDKILKKQIDTKNNIFNIPTFLSEQLNCVKTVPHHGSKPQFTSYIVLQNILKEFASEVPQGSLVGDFFFHHGDAQTQNLKKEEKRVRMTKNTFLSLRIFIQA